MQNHISPSQIKMFLMCGAGYKYSYIDGIKEDEKISTFVGKLFHKVVEIDLKSKMNNEPILDLFEVCLNRLNDRFKDLDRKPIINDIDGYQDIETKQMQSSIYTWVCLLINKYLEIKQTIEPSMIEYAHDVIIPVDGFENQILKCVIDLREVNNTLSDWKVSICTGIKMQTPKKKQSQKAKDVHTDIALSAYAMINFLIYGKLPDSIFYRHLVLNLKTEKVDYMEFKTTRTEKDILVLLKNAEEILKSRLNNCYPANGMGTWKCNKKWCMYFEKNICKFVNTDVKLINGGDEDE